MEGGPLQESEYILIFQGETAGISCSLPTCCSGSDLFEIDIIDRVATFKKNGAQCGSHTFTNDIVAVLGTVYDVWFCGPSCSPFNDGTVSNFIMDSFWHTQPNQ